MDELDDGLILLMNAPDEVRGPINLGRPSEVTMLELAHRIVELTGSRSRLVFEALPADDPAQRRPDITRARALLGWEPKIELVDGLLATIRYFEGRLASLGATSANKASGAVVPEESGPGSGQGAGLASLLEGLFPIGIRTAGDRISDRVDELLPRSTPRSRPPSLPGRSSSTGAYSRASCWPSSERPIRRWCATTIGFRAGPRASSARSRIGLALRRLCRRADSFAGIGLDLQPTSQSMPTSNAWCVETPSTTGSQRSRAMIAADDEGSCSASRKPSTRRSTRARESLELPGRDGLDRPRARTLSCPASGERRCPTAEGRIHRQGGWILSALAVPAEAVRRGG